MEVPSTCMCVQSTTKKKQRKKKLFLNFQKRRNQEEAGLGVPCISFYFTEFPPSTLLVFKKNVIVCIYIYICTPSYLLQTHPPTHT